MRTVEAGFHSSRRRLVGGGVRDEAPRAPTRCRPARWVGAQRGEGRRRAASPDPSPAGLTTATRPVVGWVLHDKRETREPPRARDQPLPAPARPQPGRLVPVGRGGAGPRARGGQADLPVDRLLGLPLVPRDGARVVRERRHRGAHERALRQHQGRPRGATRPGRDLHGRDPASDPAGRLAELGLPDARHEAVLRRHLFPARRAIRTSWLP